MEIIDGLDSLLGLFKSEEEFVLHFVQNILFFRPEIVTNQSEKFHIRRGKGYKIPVRYSTKFKDLYLIKNSNEKELLNVKNRHEAYRVTSDNEIFHPGMQTNIIVDRDGNRFVREIIKEYTGILVSQGSNSNIINYTISHVWGNTENPYFFSLLWNITLIPTYLAFILDKPDNHNLIIDIKNLVKAICMKLYSPNKLMKSDNLVDEVNYKYRLMAESLINKNLIEFVTNTEKENYKSISNNYKAISEVDGKYIDNLVIHNKIDSYANDTLATLNGLKSLENKSFIVTSLKILKEKDILENQILDFLTSKGFCNNNFEMHFPILREINEGISKEDMKTMYTDSKGNVRYYKRNMFLIWKGRKFIICNDWYPIQREKFLKWIMNKIS
ncbi:hypothetical protein AN1V17_43200 [Vallitalea sediminicola]